MLDEPWWTHYVIGGPQPSAARRRRIGPCALPPFVRPVARRAGDFVRTRDEVSLIEKFRASLTAADVEEMFGPQRKRRRSVLTTRTTCRARMEVGLRRRP